MSEAMKQAFGLVRRPWGIFYLKNKLSGVQTSLKTSDKHEAQRILQAHNESACHPHFNLSLARVYLNGADPKQATKKISKYWRRKRQRRDDTTQTACEFTPPAIRLGESGTA